MAIATIKFYAYISAAWVELKDAASASPLRGSWGMSDNKPTSRLADVGMLSLALNNSDGAYTPGGPSAISGWKKGIPLKMVITWDGADFIRFRGVVTDIRIRPSNKEKLCYVTVEDWLSYAAKHPLINPGIETNQRGDEVMQTIIDLIEVDPQSTDLETGFETFPTSFDAITSTTKAYEEFAKISLSELGFVYLKKDKETGEQLVFESSTTRHGWKLADQIPADVLTSTQLINENGDYAINEDDAEAYNDELLAVTFDETIISDFEAVYGEHVINRMTCYANPRKLSASPEVLFRLSAPMAISSGQTITIKGTYADPNGGLPIHGMDMITPAATTDYLVNTLSTGAGTNITADLVLVSIVYGTEGFTHQVKNNNTSNGFITLYNTRGTGIYVYNPIQHTASDSASIAEFEAISDNVNQAYKNNLYSGSIFVESIVDEFKQPRVVLNSITFCANRSDACMAAFLYSDIGSIYYISIPELGITGNHYIQGIEVEMNGGLIFVKWIVAAALSIQTGCGLTPIAVEFAESTEEGVNYGYIPRLTDLPIVTYSAWVYPVAQVGTARKCIITFSNGDSGLRLYEISSVTAPETDRRIVFNNKAANNASWVSDDVYKINTLNHVVVVYDRMNVTTAAPTIYVNGTAVSATETVSPIPPIESEISSNLVIGNQLSATDYYNWPYVGQIFDPRIYNRILTADEVVTLYNSGTPDASLVTDGIVFQGLVVRTGDLSNYIDQTLTSALTLRDNAYGTVGFVHGAPIGREKP